MKNILRSSILRPLLSGLFGLGLALTAGCGDTDTGCTTNAECNEGQVCDIPTGTCKAADACGGDCLGCRADGDCCDYSINCAAGSICNISTEALYDPDKAANICLKVVCATNADCEAPKTCSLQKICETPVCQRDADCGGGNVCLGGECASAPNQADAASCRVLTAGASMQQGSTLELVAVAKNANGVVLPLIRFGWESDNTGAVSITGNTATGGASSGTANVSARVEGTQVACTGAVALQNFAAIGPNQARVVVVSDKNGAPVAQANVVIISGGNATENQTGSDGSVTVDLATAVDSVTVVKAGWQSVSVVGPGTKDIYLPIPADPDLSKAGGFRGNVDLSATRKADIKLGLVAPSLPFNLLDFDFESLIGDFVPTVINAPDLGLDNQAVGLPGGIMLALSNNMFTDDTGQPGGGIRCQGEKPNAAVELGCYAARAPAGPVAAWALAGQLRLSDVTPIVGTLSNAFGGEEEIAVGGILTAILPLFQRLYHGINPGVVVEEFPRVPSISDDQCSETKPCTKQDQVCDAALGFCKYQVDCTNLALDGYDDKCRGDFTKYEKIPLAASRDLGVLSKVLIPTLPRLPGGKFSGGVVVLGAAVTPGRGLIPLGLSVGLDSLDGEVQDGKVAGIDKPFGPDSEKLQDGYTALSMAPAHSGIEGSQLALIALSLDPDTITSAGVQLSGLVAFKDRVNETDNFGSAAFMTMPEGSISVASASYTKTAGADDAKVMRVELQNGGRTWLVYAPQGNSISFPDAAGLRESFLASGLSAYIQGIRSPVQYNDIWRFGSGSNLDRTVHITEGFVLQGCDTDAGSVCLIQ